jgi:hypothetical protein
MRHEGRRHPIELRRSSGMAEEASGNDYAPRENTLAIL